MGGKYHGADPMNLSILLCILQRKAVTTLPGAVLHTALCVRSFTLLCVCPASPPFLPPSQCSPSLQGKAKQGLSGMDCGVPRVIMNHVLQALGRWTLQLSAGPAQPEVSVASCLALVHCLPGEGSAGSDGTHRLSASAYTSSSHSRRAEPLW